MLSKLQKVIRLVMFLCRHGRCKQKRAAKGGLLVLLSQSGLLVGRRLIFTVACAGQCFTSFHKRRKEIFESLSSFISLCDCPHQEELCKFSEDFKSLQIFTISFQGDQEGQDVETETERFLQRVSLVNSQITILFKVRNKHKWQQVFSFKSRRCQLVLDHFFSRDSTMSPFSAGCLTSCCRMHLDLGERIPLLLPSEAVEAGLCGEMSVTCLTTLSPCMKQYPNWPARLSHIHVLVYSPSGIPVMRGDDQTQLTFLQSLADLLLWEKLGLAKVHRADAHIVAGSLFYEMEFSTEDEFSPKPEPMPGCSQAVYGGLKSEVHTVEQTVTLFLLIQYSDPFLSQFFDFLTSEEILERQLDRVLWHNAERMRSALQALLEKTLGEFLKRKKSREKLQSAMSVMRSSVISIVSGSSSAEFRSACLNCMKVQNTNDLSVSLHQALQKVISGRFVSKVTCMAEKAVDPVLPEINASERLDACLLGKRAEREVEGSPEMFKRWCSEEVDGEWDSPKSSWETLDLQRTSLSSLPQSPRQNEKYSLQSSGTCRSTTELKNQQIESEWFQELENFSEWD